MGQKATFDVGCSMSAEGHKLLALGRDTTSVEGGNRLR
jgi:hypothetical protein